ncbi:MAG: class I SAM-dependent methyltransferase [Deltaproteobacteria bacterium]|nr:class I SAM-dependent methyltransferase [Deltaproteobacteria bacterium]
MWQGQIASFLPNRWKYRWRYWRRDTPWDTQVTPPEVMEFIARTPPGRALDLGCGTGTNAITLTRHGWRVTGVDFVPGAIHAARAKAARSGLAIDFHVASVTDLSFLDGLFDYVLDIGCLHSLKAEDRMRYAANLSRLLRPRAWYMLYAWFPRAGKCGAVGISAEEVESLLGADFSGDRTVTGEEKGDLSAWYWYQRR